MKKAYQRMLSLALMVLASATLSAQKPMSMEQIRNASYKERLKHNPYSVNYKQREVLAFGTFYVEYNPHTWRHSDEVWSKSTNNYHGISIGFSYFVPFAGAMGIEAGLKGQYLFRNWKEHDMKYNFEMLSATVPVNLALDLEAADGFVIHPYGGLYARYNISARTKEDTKVNDKDRRFTYNWFKDDVVIANSNIPPTGEMDRFQWGWQVGVNLRFGDMVTIGGGYWMDLKEVANNEKMRGFNITLGANF